MKMSRRAQRMERQHKRRRGMASLSLVSFMDIFTILVFFLLVNSSEVEIIPSSKVVTLPESVTEQRPRETVLVVVNETDILVQGEKVAAVEEVMNDSAPIIESLAAAMQQQAAKTVLQEEGAEPVLREVTIMGDKEIPYRLLKKVMLSCTRAEYERISLAVIRRAPEAG
jgi:biopolymer transport protein TolR